MKLTSLSFLDGEPLSERYASQKNTSAQTTESSDNVSPHLAWSEGPDDAKSYVVICADHDVPADFSHANQAGSTIPENASRTTMHHWVVADLPAALNDLQEGAFSEATSRPDDMPQAVPHEGRCGLNDLQRNRLKQGGGSELGRYDGPAPPWNDLRVHRYVFTVYALSIPTLQLPADFGADDVVAAMHDHILDQASLTGVYTLNPDLAPRQIGPTTAT